MSKASDFFAGGGGGGDTVTRYISGNQNIPKGSSGDVLVITPAADRRVKITSLGSVSAVCSDMTLLIGGEAVISNAGITFGGSSNTIGTFGVNAQTYTNTARSVEAIVGGLGEEVILRREAGNTNSAIVYMYELGE